VLEFRHHDRSNQLGDLAQGAYSDWTGYASRNRATALPIRAKIVDANRWQPLTYISSTGDLTTQRFMAAQGCYVTPFALSKGDEFRALLPLSGPAKYGSEEYQQQAQELVQISANLTDRKKMIAEYWSDVTDSEQPPGRWMQFARWISARDHHTLDDDVKMFFVLINAVLRKNVVGTFCRSARAPCHSFRWDRLSVGTWEDRFQLSADMNLVINCVLPARIRI